MSMNDSQAREGFGYLVMGPILAEMLLNLHVYLDSPDHSDDAIVLFCARGGLMLRRALELFSDRMGLKPRLRRADLMVSRLTAARAALQNDETAIAPLIELELASCNCAEAARALTDIYVEAEAPWDASFNLARFTELLQTTETGKQVRQAFHEQAELLRRHINEVLGATSRAILCDTGVFGSIARYLQLGVPQVSWSAALLFRSNYKKMPTPHFDITRGVVCESNVYIPWQPMTSILLYWQLMESMLEPRLPSVRCYYLNAHGSVISNLQIADWRDCLKPAAGSLMAGALKYVASLSPRAMNQISDRARRSWNNLRRKIVFPSCSDVSLLAAGRRDLNFGADRAVTFPDSQSKKANSLRDKVGAARCSMWPEGELRRQFPNAAWVFLLASEMKRTIYAACKTIAYR
jgi:hypothetical protein